MVPLLQKMLGSYLPSILGHPFLPGLLPKIQAKEAQGKCGGRWGGWVLSTLLGSVICSLGSTELLFLPNES